jgi:hypothetical protein
MNKFKSGDKVRTKSGIDGVITKIKGTKIFVKTTSGIELSYSEEELSFRYPQLEGRSRLNYEYVGEKCPRCQTPWTITSFGAKKWYHCVPCNKKADDLILGHSSPPPLPTGSSSGDSAFSTIEEWDEYIDSLNLDDFDPWSF